MPKARLNKRSLFGEMKEFGKAVVRLRRAVFLFIEKSSPRALLFAELGPKIRLCV
jgi:hypothetical protein